MAEVYEYAVLATFSAHTKPNTSETSSFYALITSHTRVALGEGLGWLGALDAVGTQGWIEYRRDWDRRATWFTDETASQLFGLTLLGVNAGYEFWLRRAAERP